MSFTTEPEGVEFAIAPVSEEAEAAVAAARRLAAALLRADQVPVGEMAKIAAQLDELADQAESGLEPVAPTDRTWSTRSMIQAALRNPANGRQNAIAPGLRMTGLPDASVIGEVTLGPQYEGPPGCVHGGVSALLLDHVFGAANHWAGVAGPTATLDLRYRRPTPLLTPLTLRARQESADGRKLRTRGVIEANGKVCVEAEGLFIVKHDFGPRS